MNTKEFKAAPRFLPFLCMLYVTLMTTPMLFIYKPVSIGFLTTTTAGLLSPFNFVLSDIIAEVYGYKTSKYVFICGLVCQFLFSLITTCLRYVPSPLTWHDQYSFDYVMHGFLRIYFIVLLGHFISIIINIYLISKWKILLKGKYFWLRSIGASGIGEFIYSVITAVMIFWGIVFGKELVIYVILVCCLKWIVTIIFAFPANLVVFILKKIEGSSITNYEMQFNPFLLSKEHEN